MTKKSKKMLEKHVKEYHDRAYELACMLSKIQDMQNRFEFMMNEAQDNGDPFFDADQVINKLGYLLSSVVIYEHETEQELKGLPNAGNDEEQDQ